MINDKDKDKLVLNIITTCIRVIVLGLCLLATRGTPLFLFALYLLFKEVNIYVRVD